MNWKIYVRKRSLANRGAILVYPCSNSKSNAIYSRNRPWTTGL
jgi:hypothetical protein